MLMNAIKKLFGGIEMTWPKVIIMAIVTAAYTALINQVSFLKDTSFQDIAISFECWVFFAMIIMMNAKKPLESAVKTFVFFLISQPLIYLIEVPFLGWSVMGYYRNWILWTVLTFPMAFVGNYLRKKNWFSLVIIIPALAFLGYIGMDYMKTAVFAFPYHLLSALFCFASMFVFALAVTEQKKQRLIALVVSSLIVIAAVVVAVISPTKFNATLKASDEDFPFDDTYTVSIENKKLGTVSIEQMDDFYVIQGDFKRTGSTKLVLEDANGNRQNFDLIVGLGTYSLKESK